MYYYILIINFCNLYIVIYIIFLPVSYLLIITFKPNSYELILINYMKANSKHIPKCEEH
jgi:hypothetical protein